MKTYKLEIREIGEVIDIFTTYEEAKEQLDKYEQEDQANGDFTENYYNILEVEKFYIADGKNNSNSVQYVMNEAGDLCGCEGNCMSFDSQEEAIEIINNKGWNDWAYVTL